MLRFRRGSGLALVAAVSVTVIATPAAAAHAAGNPCDSAATTSTYTAAGSPYDEGTVGLTAESGNCIIIDASAGPVVFEFAPTAAVTLEGSGSIETINTSTSNTVTFEPESGKTLWGGIVRLPETDPASGPSPMVQLTNAVVIGAGVDVFTPDLTISDATVDGPVCANSYGGPSDATAVVDSLSVTTATACPHLTDAVDLRAGTTSGTLTVTDSTVNVTSSSIGGMELSAAGLFTGPPNIEPTTDDIDLVAHGNAINGVRTADALEVRGIMNNNALTGVGGNSGADDVDPLTNYDDAGVFGDLTWPATPAESSSAQPLGIDGSLADFQGSVAVAAGAGVTGSLTVPDGAITAAVGPTYFYGRDDADSIALTDAEVNGEVTIDAGASDPESTITGSSVSGVVNLRTQSMTGTPLAVTNSAVGGGINVMAPGGGTVNVTGSRLTGSTTWGLLTSGAASLACDVVAGNFGGVSVGTGSTITSTDLEMNTNPQSTTTFDLRSTAEAGSPVDAEGNYWGQAGGPVPGQVSGPADTTNSLDSAPPCAANDPAVPQGADQFQSTAGDQSTTLTWTNPTDPTFTGDVVRMLPGDRAPATPQEGTQVYSGTGTTVTVGSLKLGQIYSFTIFSSASDAALPGVASTDGASRLPLPVTGLTATPAIGSATLNWTPSADPDTTTVICAAESTGPPNPYTCTPVYQGSVDEATVTSGSGDTTFYAWSKDSEGAFSAVPSTVDVYFTRVGSLVAASDGAPHPTRGQDFEILGGESGQPATQKTVVFELYRGTPAGTHKLVETKRANPVGFRIKVRVKVATSYFVVAEPTSTVTGAVSPPVVAVPERWIGLRKPDAVKHGHDRRIAGRVRPHSQLSRVTIYSQPIPGAPGTAIGHAKVHPTGRFEFMVEPPTKGSYRYFVQTAKSKQYAISLSNVVILKAT